LEILGKECGKRLDENLSEIVGGFSTIYPQPFPCGSNRGMWKAFGSSHRFFGEKRWKNNFR
jgi:hypothetical protein